MSSLVRKAVLAGAGVLFFAGSALAEFRILNVVIDRSKAASVYNERRDSIESVGGDEIIQLAKDILQVQVENRGAEAVALGICIEAYDLTMNNAYIGKVENIMTKNPVPPGTSTLTVMDFDLETAPTVTPNQEYADMLKSQYENASPDTIIRDLGSRRILFKVCPCGSTSGCFNYYFTLTAPPQEPVRVSSPMDNAVVCEKGLQFIWFPAMLGGQPAAKYQLEVFEGEDAVNRIYISDETINTSGFYPPDAKTLEQDKVYVWKVTASDSMKARTQSSKLYRFKVRCFKRDDRVTLAEVESILRRLRPDVFANMGKRRLVALTAKGAGGIESPEMQKLMGELSDGSATITDLSIPLGKGGPR